MIIAMAERLTIADIATVDFKFLGMASQVSRRKPLRWVRWVAEQSHLGAARADMVDSPVSGSGVRPTRSCLDDLSLPVPSLRVPLEGLDHDVAVRAQRLSEQTAAGGGDWILAFDDCVSRDRSPRGQPR